MRPGHVLSGRYRLDERLGFGGMGEVWRCTDLLLRRTVAVKVLHPHIAQDAEFLGRFAQEARTLAALNADGIVRMHDLARDDAAVPPLSYLVMEYVPGRTLSDIAASQERLAPAFVLRLITDVARALGAAHRAGIVHRDVKPGNIIVGADGRATLVDFGIAYTPEQTRHTSPDQIVGTLGYTSPEQLRGEPLTPSADVYALGAVAHRCLSGAPLFDGGTATIVAGHLHRPAPRLPADVPTRVAEVVTRALAKTPAERYRTATELAEALDTAARGGRTARPAVRKGRWIGAGIAVAALVTAAVLAANLLPGGGGGGLDPGASPSATTEAVGAGLAHGVLVDSRDGVLYRLAEDGTLAWYRHLDPDGGAATWAPGSGRTVATGWRDRIATSGCKGVVYSVDRAGRLYWYHDTDPENGGVWSAASGTVLREDFGRFIRVLADFNGTLYGIEPNGNLFWYRHTSPDDGPVTWDPRSGTWMGSGWDPTMAAGLGGCDGVFYLLRPNAELAWMLLKDPVDLVFDWSGPNRLADDWSRFGAVAASDSGVVYARTHDGRLYWFRHLHPGDGRPGWAEADGRLIAEP